MSHMINDNTSLSDLDVDLLIEKYGGGVDSQFAKASIIRNFIEVRRVTDTDTITLNRVGKTTLQVLVPGVTPDPIHTPFGRVQLVVDTVILARDTQSTLNAVQAHIDVKGELVQDHGKQMAKLFDEAHLIMTIKGAGQSAPTNLNGAIGAGKTKTLAQAGDDLDPDLLYDKIADIIVDMQEEDIDVGELVVFVRPRHFKVLVDNDKLLSAEFSPGNGNFADGQVYRLMGARIVPTARIPNAVIANHPLSNANNGNAYNVNSTEARTVAVVMHPRSLLSGESIPLMSDIYLDKKDKVWYIDSWMSFAVTVRRPDCCGRVLKAA